MSIGRPAAFFRSVAPDAPWLLGYVLLVPTLIAGTLATGLAKHRHRRQLTVGLLFIGWLASCHAAGEFIGHFFVG